MPTDHRSHHAALRRAVLALAAIGVSHAGLYGLAVVMLLAAGCIAVAQAALKRSAASKRRTE